MAPQRLEPFDSHLEPDALMAKTTQCPVTRYARGVKLTLDHVVGEDVNHALDAMQSAAASAGLRDTVEERGVSKHAWILPWVGAAGVQDDAPGAFWPFTLPPFQQDFVYSSGTAGDYANLVDPEYRNTLVELCISLDQMAERFAVVGPCSSTTQGSLTDADMNRYDMTVRLLERDPSCIVGATGDTNSFRELLKFEIDGVVAFGTGEPNTALSRTNPLVVSDLNVTLQPYKVYIWQVNCPGLFDAAALGTKDVVTVTCTVAGAAGDTARITIGATNYDYVVVGGDTAAMIMTALVALIDPADPIYNAIRVGAVITLTSKSSHLSAVVVASFIPGAPGTFTNVHTTTGVPGTVEFLSLVSLNLMGTMLSPLTQRDETFDSQQIQNIPENHDGSHVGYAIPKTDPAGGAVITGTDVQENLLHGFDRALRQRAASGYGQGYGALGNDMQASDINPKELLLNDSHYQMIVVPFWSGQYRESVRVRDLPEAGLPFTSAPWAVDTDDRRVIPVPEGFVLHHAFAVWNGYSPKTTVHPFRTAHGSFPDSAIATTYLQEVNIALNTGWRGDDYLYQQVAYLKWSAALVGAFNYDDFLIDEFRAKVAGTFCPTYRMLQIPIVHPVGPPLWDDHSWKESGVPFFMGKSNTLTANRADCGTLPSAFGGGALHVPTTLGRENTLEIRWLKNFGSLVNLGNEDVLVGQGGEFVILLGKQTLGG